MKIWIQKLALLGVTLAIALLAAEFGVRALVYVPRGTPFVVENPDTIFNNKPNITGRHISPGEFNYEFNTNAQGFRGVAPVAKAAVAPRVLCLGDSFTFGIGAADAETWPVRLEARLNATGAKTAVINAGVMGWGLTEYWVWAQLHAKEYAPKLIIVGCHASDWENAYDGLVSLQPDGTLQAHQVIRQDVSRLKAVAEKIPCYDFLVTHSALAALIKQSVVQLTWTGTIGGMANGPPEDTANAVEQAAPLNKALLAGLQKTAAEAGAALLVVFIPSHGEMEWDDKEHHNFRRFRDLIKIWAGELAIPYMDATLILRSYLEKNHLPVPALYHVRNGHCTPLGYDVIAQGMADVISQHPDWLTHGTASNPSPRQ